MQNYPKKNAVNSDDEADFGKYVQQVVRKSNETVIMVAETNEKSEVDKICRTQTGMDDTPKGDINETETEYGALMKLELMKLDNLEMDAKHQRRIIQWTKYFAETETEMDAKVKSMMKLVERDWICKVCKKNYKNRIVHLKDHVESHLGGVSHQCPDCGKMYGSTSSMRKHYGDPNRCKNVSRKVGLKGRVVVRGEKQRSEGINNSSEDLNDDLKKQKECLEGPNDSLIDPKNNFEGLNNEEQGSKGPESSL